MIIRQMRGILTALLDLALMFGLSLVVVAGYAQVVASSAATTTTARTAIYVYDGLGEQLPARPRATQDWSHQGGEPGALNGANSAELARRCISSLPQKQ